MACYHPLKAFPIDLNPSGKPKYKICSYEVDHLERGSDGVWREVFDHQFNPYARGVSSTATVIPCGQCVGCRLEYSRQWANRCMLELQYHDSAYFVTLTYNDLHVPTRFYGDPETGEALPSLSLNKRDFQLFMKRLRKSFPDDHIRFFAAGEYGSTTFRPHYHAIIFGLHLDDLVPYQKSQQGYQYYGSESLQRCWSVKSSTTPLAYEPLGFVVVGEVTWETCAYTARYVMKKLTGQAAEFYEEFNIDQPFTLMSRKPGIARQYYDDHPDLWKYDYINVATGTGGRKFRPPRYYDRLFDLDDPDAAKEMKAQRRIRAMQAAAGKLRDTSLSYLDQLAVEEENLKARIKSLERSL